MPYKTVGGEKPGEEYKRVELYYEVHGPPDAPPIVFIGGWASYHWIWFRQIPEMSEKYRCIVFDNRGAGRSSKPDYPYTIKMMADDTVGLMEALGIENAHILGISMGGLIAQQVALSYPEKLRSLIIVSSHFGGPNQIPMDDRTMALLIAVPTETISAEQARDMRYQATFSPGFLQENEDILQQIERWIAQYPAPLYAQIHQSSATAGFNSESELGKITAPTLIIHGTADRAVPTGNSDLLASKIPNARKVLLEGAAHFCIIEKYEEFNKTVMGFIDEIEGGPGPS